MSMNFSEFKKLLGADPLNRDPKTLRARNSAPEFERAAVEAEAFERKLRSAIAVSAPGDGFLEDIMSIPASIPGSVAGAVTRRPTTRLKWFALAASVLIMVGVAGLSWRQAHLPKTIEEYVAVHYQLDGQELIDKARPDFDPKTITRIMASLEMTAGEKLADRIQFIKFCPTLDGRGAHMIVQTDRGLITVIYMPGTTVRDRRIVKFGTMQAYLVALEVGSAAIIGSADQAVSTMDELVRNSIFRST